MFDNKANRRLHRECNTKEAMLNAGQGTEDCLIVKPKTKQKLHLISYLNSTTKNIQINSYTIQLIYIRINKYR